MKFPYMFDIPLGKSQHFPRVLFQGLVDCVPSSPGRLHEGGAVGRGGHLCDLRGDLRLGQGGRALAHHGHFREWGKNG